jgi:hypothetical protein
MSVRYLAAYLDYDASMSTHVFNMSNIAILLAIQAPVEKDFLVKVNSKTQVLR